MPNTNCSSINERKWATFSATTNPLKTPFSLQTRIMIMDVPVLAFFML